MRTPEHQWEKGEPPAPKRGGGNTRGGRTNWSFLLGIASTKPGTWLTAAGDANAAYSLNQEDGFESVFREGKVWLRAVPVKKTATRRKAS